MKRINLLLKRLERKKYRKLRRWETLYGQIYGPRTVAKNFALEPWSLALGGYFTRHGQRSGATQASARLLRRLYQSLRGRGGEHCWVLQLAENTTQSHQRPEFLYTQLKQRFPFQNPELQRRWIRQLRRRALVADHQRRQRQRRGLALAEAVGEGEGEGGGGGGEEGVLQRLGAQPLGATLSLDSVLQLPRLAMLRHRQLQLWWETPRALLLSPRHLQLRRVASRTPHRRRGASAALEQSHRRAAPAGARRRLRRLSRLSRLSQRSALKGLRATKKNSGKLVAGKLREPAALPSNYQLRRWLKPHPARRRLLRSRQPNRQLPSSQRRRRRRWRLWLRRKLQKLQRRGLLPEAGAAAATSAKAWRHLQQRLKRLLKRTTVLALLLRLQASAEAFRRHRRRLRQQRSPHRRAFAGTLALALRRSLKVGLRRWRHWYRRVTPAERRLLRRRTGLSLRRLRQDLHRLLRRWWRAAPLSFRLSSFALLLGLRKQLQRRLQLLLRRAEKLQRRWKQQQKQRKASATRHRSFASHHRSRPFRTSATAPALRRSSPTRRRAKLQQRPGPQQRPKTNGKGQTSKFAVRSLRGPLRRRLHHRSSPQERHRLKRRRWRSRPLLPTAEQQQTEIRELEEQWRQQPGARWRTVQAQQLDSLDFCWETPRSAQLGRWRRQRRRYPSRFHQRVFPKAGPNPTHRRRNTGGVKGRKRQGTAAQRKRSEVKISLQRPRPQTATAALRQQLRPRRRLWRRRLAFRPQIHYQLLELNLQDQVPLLDEETGLPLLAPFRRYLLVKRRYGAVGYNALLRDCFTLLTPQLRLRSQLVGHKSARRTVYQIRAGAPLSLRVRTLFGWLRELVNKNEDYNLLRRNTARKPSSKKVRTKPERSRRCLQRFYPRLATELRRLLAADEPLLKQLALFDKHSARLRTPRRHYRWEV